MKPFWPGVVGMSLMGLIGTALLYATYSDPYHVAPAVPLVGLVWCAGGWGAAVYFVLSKD